MYTKQINNKLFFKGIVIWILATLFYFFDNLLNVSPAAMKPELSKAFNLSAADLGILASCYLWAYGLMQIPAGLLMDRIGPRRLLTNASLVCAFGSLLFAGAEIITTAQLGRVLIGIGASFAVVGCSKIAAVWFPAARFGVFTGLMVTVGMLGAAFGLAVVNYVTQILNWRTTMYSSAVIGLILGGILWLIVRDRPDQVIISEQAGIAGGLEILNTPTAGWQGLRKILSSKQLWVAAIYASLMFVPTLAFGGLWGVPYLVEGHGLTRELAGFLVSLIFIGWMFGGPIYGVISEYLKLRNLPMYVANVVTLLICVALITIKDLSVPVIGGLMFGLGLFSSGFILAFAVTKESNDQKLAATAIGFINSINTFGGAGLQWMIGKILDVTATNYTITEFGERIFTYQDYRTALLSIPGCLLLALGALALLKETHCKTVEQLQLNKLS